MSLLPHSVLQPRQEDSTTSYADSETSSPADSPSSSSSIFFGNSAFLFFGSIALAAVLLFAFTGCAIRYYRRNRAPPDICSDPEISFYDKCLRSTLEKEGLSHAQHSERYRQVVAYFIQRMNATFQTADAFTVFRPAGFNTGIFHHASAASYASGARFIWSPELFSVLYVDDIHRYRSERRALRRAAETLTRRHRTKQRLTSEEVCTSFPESLYSEWVAHGYDGPLLGHKPAESDADSDSGRPESEDSASSCNSDKKEPEEPEKVSLDLGIRPAAHLELDTCPICIDAFTDEDRVRALPCDHVFHTACIDKWLTKRNGSCPMCKRNYFRLLHPEADRSGEREAEREAERNAGRDGIVAPEVEYEVSEQTREQLDREVAAGLAWVARRRRSKVKSPFRKLQWRFRGRKRANTEEV